MASVTWLSLLTAALTLSADGFRLDVLAGAGLVLGRAREGGRIVGRLVRARSSVFSGVVRVMQ